MEDKDIIALYWERSERAIEETDIKYGKLCRSISMGIVDDRRDSEEVIKKRLASATGELAYASEYDYIIVNDIAERATQKVLTVMEAERYRAARTYFIIDEICHCRKEE